MNQSALRIVTRVLIVLVLFCVPSIALADGITWTLSGVTFDDGGTATGSFVFDAVADTVSSINIVTTAGSTFLGTTYTALDPGYIPPSPAGIVFVPNGVGDLTGTFVLDFEFDTSLTNSGGTVGVAGTGLSFEGICLDSGCVTPANSPYRLVTAGDVVSTGVPVPEPSALLLLIVGCAFAVCVAKLKLVQV